MMNNSKLFLLSFLIIMSCNAVIIEEVFDEDPPAAVKVPRKEERKPLFEDTDFIDAEIAVAKELLSRKKKTADELNDTEMKRKVDFYETLLNNQKVWHHEETDPDKLNDLEIYATLQRLHNSIRQIEPSLTEPKLEGGPKRKIDGVSWKKPVALIGAGVVGLAAVGGAVYAGLSLYNKQRISNVLKQYGKTIFDLSAAEKDLAAIFANARWMCLAAPNYVQKRVKNLQIADPIAPWLWPVYAELYFGRKPTEARIAQIQELVQK
jgi:hypothetical protein